MSEDRDRPAGAPPPRKHRHDADAPSFIELECDVARAALALPSDAHGLLALAIALDAVAAGVAEVLGMPKDLACIDVAPALFEPGVVTLNVGVDVLESTFLVKASRAGAGGEQLTIAAMGRLEDPRAAGIPRLSMILSRTGGTVAIELDAVSNEGPGAELIALERALRLAGEAAGSTTRPWARPAHIARFSQAPNRAAVVSIRAVAVEPNMAWVTLLDAEGAPAATLEGVDFGDSASGRQALPALVMEVARATLGEAFGPNDNLVRAGLGSLDILRLLDAIEHAFHRRIGRNAFLRDPTLAGLAALCELEACADPAFDARLSEGEPRPARAVPLTTAERHLWLLEQSGTLAGTYNELIVFRLDGRLDRDALSAAMAQVVHRHPGLRSGFHAEGAELLRNALIRAIPDSRFHDFASLDPEAAQRAATSAIAAHACEPFDLHRGPLLRWISVRMPDATDLLALVAHHLVIDEWSLGRVLLPELCDFYRLPADVRPEPSPAPASLPDRAAREEASRTGSAYAASLAWWTRYLDQAVQPLQLSAAAAADEGAGYDGHVETFPLDPAAIQRLGALARSAGATPASGVMAALQLVLNRLCEEEVFCIGVFCAGRDLVADAGEVGYYANLLPVRADLRGEPSVAELIARVHENMSGVLAHSRVPFAEIAQAARRAGGSSSAAGLVQVVFAQDDLPDRLELGSLRATRIGLDKGRAKFELTVTTRLGGAARAPTMTWEYRTGILDGDSVRRLAQLLGASIDWMSKNPESSISNVELLSSRQASAVIARGSGPQSALPLKRVSQMIVEQAACTPDEIAAVSHAKSLSYRDIERGSRALAAAVHRAGVRPGSFVGVALERGVELPMALLAVLRAGCAYVPLDLDQPPDRLRWIVRDAGVSAVLSSGGSARRTLSELIHVDVPAGVVEEELLPLDEGQLSIEDVAYAIYTSGSTGQPKGVLVRHAGVSNVFHGVAERLGRHESSVWLAVTSLAFDIAALELLWPLCFGGVVAVDPGLAADQPDAQDWPGRLAEVGLPQGVTHLQCTPTGLAMLLRTAEGRALLRGVRELMIGGEVLSPALVGRARSAGSARIWNMYGPTETTIWSSMHEVGRVEGPVPIGLPLRNTRFYVLDRRGRLAPDGLPGELCIAGRGVAKGYVGQRPEGDSVFVRDPFQPGASGPMYRTGDRVRWNADGELEFLGRYDGQIKMRGFRIEPAEIEEVLLRHPCVRLCAVVVHRLAGRDQLVAFVELQQPGVELGELRRHAEGFLPRYMVPHAFVVRDALPTLSSGKIDRKSLALAAPDATRSIVHREPATALEAALLRIWREELVAPAVGVDEDFADAGGDSLLALPLLARLRSELGQAVTLPLLLENPTVAKLAMALERSARIGPEASSMAPGDAVGTRSNAKILDRALDQGLDGPVIAAALATVPDAMLPHVADASWRGSPMWVASLHTDWGTLALLTLPVADSEVYDERGRLQARCQDALVLASELGAKTVSLTGLTASATGYGRLLSVPDERIKITTGHATTCGAVVLTLAGLLRETGRRIDEERLAIVGLGSMGHGVMRLLLALGMHPKSLVLADTPARASRLLRIEAEARSLGYLGEAMCCSAGAHASHKIYAATAVVGATNVGGVLDVARLPAGCLVVDDSAPHCFSVTAAFERMRVQRDVLFTGAGVLRCPERVGIKVSPSWPDRSGHSIVAAFGPAAEEIPACMLSSLMTTVAPSEAVATVGEAQLEALLGHYRWLTAHHVGHASFHLQSQAIATADLVEFARRFGHRLVL